MTQQEWEWRYGHFALRLRERYSIDISLDEYLAACDRSFSPLGRDEKENIIGWVIIKNTSVLCVKVGKMNEKYLVTCLLDFPGYRRKYKPLFIKKTVK